MPMCQGFSNYSALLPNFVLAKLAINSIRVKGHLVNINEQALVEEASFLCMSQGSTFPGAQGHMPLDFAVGPRFFQTRGPK